jgi:hypothetical protein
MRAVIAEDSMLLPEGLSRLLTETGIEIALAFVRSSAQR